MKDLLLFGLIRAPKLTRSLIPLSLKFGPRKWINTSILHDLFPLEDTPKLRKEMKELLNIQLIECNRIRMCNKALPKVKFCELSRINPRFHKITEISIFSLAKKLGLNPKNLQNFLNCGFISHDNTNQFNCFYGNPICIRSLPKKKGSEKEFFKLRKNNYSNREIHSFDVLQRPTFLDPFQVLILFFAYNYIVINKTAVTILPSSLNSALWRFTGFYDEAMVRKAFEDLCELKLFNKLGRTYTLSSEIRRENIPWNWNNIKLLLAYQKSYSKILEKIRLLNYP